MKKARIATLSEAGAPGSAGAAMWITTLVGYAVYNHRGEEVGDIKDVLLEVRSGKVAYALLSFRAIVGLGEKVFPVPWRALTFDGENRRFLLKIDKHRLADAPGYHKTRSSHITDPAWVRDIDSFYGAAKAD